MFNDRRSYESLNQVNVEKRAPIVYVTIAVFAMSLQSFYFPALGGAALCVAGLAMLLPMAKNHPDPRSVAMFLAVCLTVFFQMIFLGADILKPNFGLVISASALIVARSVFFERASLLKRALANVLMMHAAIIATQVLYFAITRDLISPLSMLGGGDVRSFSKKGVVIGTVLVPRFSGLFSEPGTYSGVIVPVLAAYFSLSRKIDRVFIISAFSVLMTLSLGGMAVVTVLGCIALGREARAFRRRRWMIVSGSILVACLALWTSFNLEKRDEITTNEDALQYIMADWALSTKSISVIGLSDRDTPEYYSEGYLGSGLDIFVSGGIFLVAAVGGFLLSLGSVMSILLASVLMISKIKITYPMLYFALGVISMSGAVSIPAGRQIKTYRRIPG